VTVKYCIKTHDVLIHEALSVHYSHHELDAALAVAEKFFVTVRVTGVAGTSTSVGVNIEHSNDGVNWTLRNALVSAFTSAAPAVNSFSGADIGNTSVGGRYVRITAACGGSGGVVSSYVEIWVCGRSSI
jgi:hypothetical protein